MEKEADFEVAGSEIIEQLPSIGLVELVIRLDFDNDFVINHQIEALGAEVFSFADDPDSELSFDVMPALPQSRSSAKTYNAPETRTRACCKPRKMLR